jgi:hypothetical protein
MLDKLAPYNKTLIGILGVVLTGLNALYGTDPRIQLLISVATVLGVYHVPNR